MIPRYTRPEMGRIWTDENRYRLWLRVELAVCEALAARGDIPRKALATIRRRAGFDAREIEKLEAKVKHDVIAFLTSVARRVGRDSRFIHVGLTSSDLLDTALALQLVEAADLLIAGATDLLRAIRARAIEHERTVMVGRTHGVHAEPITFGLKLALWYAEMERNLERLRRARETVRVGKLSGAVGTFAHQPPAVEEAVCRLLGLVPDPITSQVIQRDRHAEFVGALAIVGSSLDKFATEIRHLQRTEVREVEEPFARGQKGSSSMPHKRNPVGCEQISGIARILRANAQAALENVALWHERDISHSSVERVILPDSTILLDHALHRFGEIVAGLIVYPETMRENLDRTKGLVYSQSLLLALTGSGMSREAAYEVVQRAAMRVWGGAGSFLESVRKEPEVVARLGRQGIEACFDLDRHLRHVPELFERVFGGKGASLSTASSAGRNASGRAGRTHRKTAARHAI